MSINQKDGFQKDIKQQDDSSFRSFFDYFTQVLKSTKWLQSFPIVCGQQHISKKIIINHNSLKIRRYSMLMQLPSAITSIWNFCTMLQVNDMMVPFGGHLRVNHAWGPALLFHKCVVSTLLPAKPLKPQLLFRPEVALWSLCSHHGPSLIDSDREQ